MASVHSVQDHITTAAPVDECHGTEPRDLSEGVSQQMDGVTLTTTTSHEKHSDDDKSHDTSMTSSQPSSDDAGDEMDHDDSHRTIYPIVSGDAVGVTSETTIPASIHVADTVEDPNSGSHLARMDSSSSRAVARAIDRGLWQEQQKQSSTLSSDPSLEPFRFADDEDGESHHETWCPLGSCALGSRTTQTTVVAHTLGPHSIQELCDNLRRYPEQGLSRPEDGELLHKMVDFHRARYQRRDGWLTERPSGLLGLFLFLGELRVDLQWAEDAAWRRVHETQAVSWESFAKYHSPENQRSYFIYLVEIISIVMMIIAMWMNDWKFAPFTENPMLGPSAQVLMDLGALNSEAVVQDNEWYRLVAPFILHAGIIHLVINLLALHFIGGPVERTLGSTLTATVFLVSGFGGNVASALFIQNTVSVGASGGLFGLLGLCLAHIVANWDLLTLRNYRDRNDPAHKGFPSITVTCLLVTELMVNIVVGLTPYVDNFAHLGGLVYGLFLGFPLLVLDWTGFSLRKVHSHCHMFFTVRALSFLMGAGLLIFTTVSLANYNGQEPLCRNCRYMSCAPFPFWNDNPWWHCEDDCYIASASWTSYQNYTRVDFSCPYGEQASVQVPWIMDADDVVEQLPQLCRDYC